MVARIFDQLARDRVRTVAPFYQLHAVHDPLDDVGLEPLQEQIFGKVRVGRETNDAADEFGVRLGEPYGYPSADPGADLCANQPVIRRSATGGDAPRHLIYALPGADEHDAPMVVRRGDRFDQLLRIGEPLREAGLLDVSLRATHAVIIGHDLCGNQVSAPLNTAAEAMAWRLTKVPRNDSQDNLTQADFHTGHDEAIFVLAAPGPQARTHRVDLRQRERRQEHLCANQPVSLGVARSERRIATPSSRRRVDGVQVIMIQPRDVEKRHDI